jgi:hypothetical protein
MVCLLLFGEARRQVSNENIAPQPPSQAPSTPATAASQDSNHNPNSIQAIAILEEREQPLTPIRLLQGIILS